MDDNQEEQVFSDLSDATELTVTPLSLTDKFVGIFTEPSEIFAHIRISGPRVSDWIVPLLLISIVLTASMLIRFSNPETAAQMRDQQELAIQKQVETGKLSQEDADKVMEQIDQFSGMTKVVMPIGAVLGNIAVFFVLCLLYWLVVRFIMKGDTNYSFILSVVGLSVFISAIDQLVAILLMMMTGKAMANLSPALLLGPESKGPVLIILTALAPISIWAQYVIGVGFAKTANISLGKGLIASFAIWLLFVLVGVFSGAGV